MSKKKRRSLSGTIREKIRERVANGERQNSLAAEYGVAKTTISRIVKGQDSLKAQTPPGIIAEILRLRNEGWSTTLIAEEVKVSQHTVWRHCNSAGLGGLPPSVKHGGKRKAGPGKQLGAPPKRGTTKVPFSGRATPEVLEYLKSTGNLSESIEATVRRTKAFREWLASQGSRK